MDRNMLGSVASINCCWHCPLEMCEIALVLQALAQTPAHAAPEAVRLVHLHQSASRRAVFDHLWGITFCFSFSLFGFLCHTPSHKSSKRLTTGLVMTLQACVQLEEGLRRAERIWLTSSSVCLSSANKYAVVCVLVRYEHVFLGTKKIWYFLKFDYLYIHFECTAMWVVLYMIKECFAQYTVVQHQHHIELP